LRMLGQRFSGASIGRACCFVFESDLEPACSPVVRLEIDALEKIMVPEAPWRSSGAGKPRFNTANHNDRLNDYRPIDRQVPNRQIASCRDLSAIGGKAFLA